MNKQEMLNVSAKVAEHLLKQGVSVQAFKKMDKKKLAYEYPALEDLVEIPEEKYNEWAKHNQEEKSLNYFKSLVAFDMVYIQRKK